MSILRESSRLRSRSRENLYAEDDDLDDQERKEKELNDFHRNESTFRYIVVKGLTDGKARIIDFSKRKSDKTVLKLLDLEFGKSTYEDQFEVGNLVAAHFPKTANTPANFYPSVIEGVYDNEKDATDTYSSLAQRKNGLSFHRSGSAMAPTKQQQSRLLSAAESYVTEHTGIIAPPKPSSNPRRGNDSFLGSQEGGHDRPSLLQLNGSFTMDNSACGSLELSLNPPVFETLNRLIPEAEIQSLLGVQPSAPRGSIQSFMETSEQISRASHFINQQVAVVQLPIHDSAYEVSLPGFSGTDYTTLESFGTHTGTPGRLLAQPLELPPSAMSHSGFTSRGSPTLSPGSGTMEIVPTSTAFSVKVPSKGVKRQRDASKTSRATSVNIERFHWKQLQTQPQISLTDPAAEIKYPIIQGNTQVGYKYKWYWQESAGLHQPRFRHGYDIWIYSSILKDLDMFAPTHERPSYLRYADSLVMHLMGDEEGVLKCYANCRKKSGVDKFLGHKTMVAVCGHVQHCFGVTVDVVVYKSHINTKLNMLNRRKTGQ